MATDTVEVGPSTIRECLQAVFAWRLGELCAGNDEYVEWAKLKFGVDLEKATVQGIERATERDIPVRQFDLMLQGYLNAHEQMFLLWRSAQKGGPVDAPPIMPGGLLQ